MDGEGGLAGLYATELLVVLTDECYGVNVTAVVEYCSEESIVRNVKVACAFEFYVVVEEFVNGSSAGGHVDVAGPFSGFGNFLEYEEGSVTAVPGSVEVGSVIVLASIEVDIEIDEASVAVIATHYYCFRIDVLFGEFACIHVVVGQVGHRSDFPLGTTGCPSAEAEFIAVLGGEGVHAVVVNGANPFYRSERRSLAGSYIVSTRIDAKVFGADGVNLSSLRSRVKCYGVGEGKFGVVKSTVTYSEIVVCEVELAVPDVHLGDGDAVGSEFGDGL